MPWLLPEERANQTTGLILRPESATIANGGVAELAEGGGLEKLNRRFAIWQKIQLNPFASWKIASDLAFWICLVFPCFARILVTIW